MGAQSLVTRNSDRRGLREGKRPPAFGFRKRPDTPLAVKGCSIVVCIICLLLIFSLPELVDATTHGRTSTICLLSAALWPPLPYFRLAEPCKTGDFISVPRGFRIHHMFFRQPSAAYQHTECSTTFIYVLPRESSPCVPTLSTCPLFFCVGDPFRGCDTKKDISPVGVSCGGATRRRIFRPFECHEGNCSPLDRHAQNKCAHFASIVSHTHGCTSWPTSTRVRPSLPFWSGNCRKLLLCDPFDILVVSRFPDGPCRSCDRSLSIRAHTPADAVIDQLSHYCPSAISLTDRVHSRMHGRTAQPSILTGLSRQVPYTRVPVSVSHFLSATGQIGNLQEIRYIVNMIVVVLARSGKKIGAS